MKKTALLVLLLVSTNTYAFAFDKDDFWAKLFSGTKIAKLSNTEKGNQESKADEKSPKIITNQPRVIYITARASSRPKSKQW